MSREQLATLHQELKDIAAEKVRCRELHERKIDSMHRRWKEELFCLKMNHTSGLKPLQSEKDRAYSSAKLSLAQAVETLEMERQEAIRRAESVFKEKKALALQDYEKELDKANQEFDEQSKALEEEYHKAVTGYEEKRLQELYELNRSHGSIMDDLQLRAAAVQRRMNEGS